LMVIGWQQRAGGDGNPPEAVTSAWKQVEASQLNASLPCLLVPQPAHAVLAGILAGALLPGAFGDLPREIKQAITMHDTGWAMIDAAQIQRLRSGAPGTERAIPISFVRNSPHELAQAWTASIDSVEPISPAASIVVGRHFTLLAAGGHEHRAFLDAEKMRQRKLEKSTCFDENDLNRWTGALGFCDLVSLYLITGLRNETTFPLAHPASAQAQGAPRVTLRFEQNRLHWTPQVFQPSLGLEIDALKHPVPSQGARSERLTWESV
jgi:Protein of unknown function (DUF3891)